MAFVPQDVLDRIAALEREVRTLRGRAQMRPTLNQVLNGDVTIGEGGRLIVKDPDGTTVFATGQTPTIGDYYTTMFRDDGDPHSRSAPTATRTTTPRRRWSACGTGTETSSSWTTPTATNSSAARGCPYSCTPPNGSRTTARRISRLGRDDPRP